MLTGLLALLVVVAVTAAIAVVYQRRNGRFVDRPAASTPLVTAPSEAPPEPVAPPRDRHIGPDDVGVPLGERATLVQFSTAFCAPCRAARTLLTSVAERRDGVVYVDVDAESHLDLVRALNVVRTPTIFVLDASGTVVTRASGLPRRAEVDAALGWVPAVEM